MIVELSEKGKRVPTGKNYTSYYFIGGSRDKMPAIIPVERPEYTNVMRSGPDFENEYNGKKFAADVLNPITGDILVNKGSDITSDMIKKAFDSGVELIHASEGDRPWEDIEIDDEIKLGRPSLALMNALQQMGLGDTWQAVDFSESYDADIGENPTVDSIKELAKRILSEKADTVKRDERNKALTRTIKDRVADGEDEEDVIQDTLRADAKTPEELYKRLHTGLYNDSEKTALGNIASAIRDRWQ